MKSKLLKCALSFALASALVFVSTFMCYRGFNSSASAASVGSVIGWISTALDVYSFFEPVITAIDKSNTEAFLKSKSAYYAFWKESNVSECMTKSEFLQFCKVVTDGDIDTFCSLYGSEHSSNMSYYFDIICKATFYTDGYEGLADLIYSGGLDGYSVNGDNKVQIPSSDFKEAVEEANTNNAPKGKGLWKSSYRTDKYVHANKDTTLLTLWNSSEIGDRFCDEIYLYPFYTDYHGITYYSKYQFRVYYDMFINGDITDYALYVETYMYTDGVGYVIQPDYSVRALNGTSMTKPYTIALGKPFWRLGDYPCLDFGFYLTDNDYYSLKLHNPSYTSVGGGMVVLPADAWNFTSADGLDITLPFTESFFRNKYSDFFYIDDEGNKITAPERTDIDIGYICSNDMISRVYSDVDTTKIPDNYYVTISGDTIYDYSITNPETGQSETINYYITNNYILPDNGSSGGSGGTVGGDVTVGGQIDVTGNVGVDVNVNINNGANGGDNIGDYIDASGSDVNVSGILGKLPELSKGFVDYLKGFFSWLPVEIYSLIILILVISVWNVFRSRR